MADNADAPKGVLVALTGGPGRAAWPSSRARASACARCCATTAWSCSTSAAPAPGRCAARRCSARWAPRTSPCRRPARSRPARGRSARDRRFYSTADTVADLEALRVALGADKLTLDGVSYGTFVAERYAIAHPDRVARLVLDSVVPAAGLDGSRSTACARPRACCALVCRAQHCPGDPAADLAAVVRARHDGPELDDTLVAMSVGAPTFPGVLAALREARAGASAASRPDRARRCAAPSARRRRSSARACTRRPCAPTRARRGAAPAAPLAGREAALRRAAAGTDPAPYDRATVVGNGFAQTCLRWPPTPAPPPPRSGDLPPVPTLLLAGDRDLSTPLPWAREQAAHTPAGQARRRPRAPGTPCSRGPPAAAGRRAVERFLLG